MGKYITEEQIIAGFNDRDEAAFAGLYQRMYGWLVFYASGYVQHAEAEDVTAEAFIRLWRLPRSARFSHFAEVRRWLQVAVRNACIDLLRHAARLRQKQEELSYLGEQSYEQLLFFSEVETLLFRRIHEAVNVLDPQRRTIFRMAFFEGMSNEQIAHQLGLSRQTVKNTKSDALRILRQKLGPEGLLCLAFLLSYPFFRPW